MEGEEGKKARVGVGPGLQVVEVEVQKVEVVEEGEEGEEDEQGFGNTKEV